MREIKKNIVSVRSALTTYSLSKNQYFCETPKAYEIWEDTFAGELRLKRLPKSRIFWVTEK